ncbi:GPI ethanolamine phosphate transferase 2 [Cucurbitaria berberidis CBS 394.84]|uniref:GPI ethanolamine phosphate transferase 2 n=1 Tax=Cucurbitaria berberidis CBS 394.84 TaxID=1168544 RepID=A0A9P4GTB9_9PLEO|nr:GPI ethanolamine phosphate transferase 2 [Cucurbitaria berberidis CBS 394.84]KAF1850947.1 GPI ethanolamine phosphate transferase 2 [Cucurbitaria berberidis CBS 394.84]
MATRTVLLTVANLLIPVSILIFATGFFPYKPFMPGLAEYEELGWNRILGDDWQKPPAAPFDKVIFMVVDALRSDFVFGEESGMSFVQSLIRDGTALPFTAHATSPTITMPRVKAITTGSIPSFLDVILNFAESDTTSTLATQDTWLAQIKAKQFDNGKGKLVMYGDDTWLKLFPDFFDRADGTSSFFVSDFTEVDNNVTRHVPNELLNSDWNAMIMHYLGLDHIGHKAGPKSPNMIPKQKEMDNMVQSIYSAIENEDHLANTLFVLCGDHGMNEGGNHGGSSPGETSPALVFMSPKLSKVTQNTIKESPIKPSRGNEFEYYRMVEQSDIAPTLAGLLGFPVPRNNLGVFLTEFLGFWDETPNRVQLLYRNAKQMKKIVEATYTSLKFTDEVLETGEMGFECFSLNTHLTDGQNLACLWQRVVNAMGNNDEFEHIYKFMHEAQDTMSSTASNYDVSRLVFGTGLAILVCALSYLTLPSFRPITPAGIYYALTLVLYAALMFASSYVEEEHNFWYWATSGWYILLLLSNLRKEWYDKWFFHPAIMALVVHRVIRRWNQTGQKYAGADDIVNSGIFHGNNSFVLWALIGATYMDIMIRIARHVARSIATFDNLQNVQNAEIESTDHHRMIGTVAVVPLVGTAFVFKLAFTAKDAPELTAGITGGMMESVETLNIVGLAQMVFGGLALSGIWIAFAEWQRSKKRVATRQEGNGALAVAFFDLMALFLITQTKAQNIPLYLLFRLQFFFLRLLNLSPAAVTTTTLLLTQTSFFALGNSNAISSIDLSNSYNGISGYNITAVGALVFLSNWAGPVYWSLASILLLGSHGSTQRYIETSELHVADWVTKEREYLNELARKEEKGRESRRDGKEWGRHVALLTLPKFLFAMAWGVAWHLGVTVWLGGLAWWLGTW